MSKLVDMVIDNGGEPTECMRALVMTEQTLIDTIEQVCAPLVRYAEALELLEVITGIESQGYSALKAYRAIIGDKS